MLEKIYLKFKNPYFNNKIIGINLGKNKDSTDDIKDYLYGIEELGNFSSYITINISSPNTKGLRDLQLRGNIEKLIKEIIKKEKKFQLLIKSLY